VTAKYRPLAPLGAALVAAVGCVLAVAVATAANVAAWNLADEARWPEFERFAQLLGIVGIPVLLVALALTVAFIHVGTRNLHDLGPGRPRFAGGAATWWLFVPLANVVMVHQVLTALWRESQPRPPLRLTVGFERSVALVNVWWALLLATAIASAVGPGLAHGHGALAHIATQWTETALRLAAGGCFIAIVRGVVRRQRQQWADLEQRRSAPAPTASALR
jgi:hypothetical protein